MNVALLLGQTEPPVTFPPTGQGGELGPLTLPAIEYSALLPWLILMGGAVVLLAASSLSTKRPPRGMYALFTVGTAGASLASSWQLWERISERGATTAVANAIAVDGFSIFFSIAIASALVVAALIADSYLPREGL